LPSDRESGGNWPEIQQVFADATTEPAMTDVQAASDSFREFLTIRKDSPLFRLRTADDIQQRLSFHNTGPAQVPGVIVMELDGCVSAGVNDQNYSKILTVFNATNDPQTVDPFGTGAPPVACGIADTGNDPAVPFGAEMFVRGSVSSDWAAVPGVNNLVNTGGNTLEAQFMITAGDHLYKVADDGWAIERAFTGGDTQLDTLVTMTDVGGGGPNGTITIARDGCYSWTVDGSDTNAPLLTVTNRDEIWDLHPVQVASADPVVQTAIHNASGFTVPARTTAVFVQPQTGEACTIGADFNTAAFVRGGFNGWDTSAPLKRVGDTDVLEATVNVTTGSHEYKVASDDWATVNCGGPEGGGTLPTPVDASTVLECGENPENLSVDAAADSDLKFSLDTAALITPTITIGAPEGTGFAGDIAMVRGGFNGWGNADTMTAVGPDALEVTLNVTTGSHEFKVASDDWATINCGGPKDGSPMGISLDTATTLSCNANPANLSLSFPADGDYTFSLDKLDAGNPTLTVAPAVGGAFGTVSVFTRGGFNGWGEADELVNTSGNLYEATVAVTAGSFEFKVASSDWATINCGRPGNAAMPVPLDTATTLSCKASSENLSITFGADGDVTFSVDATNNYNPTVTVTAPPPP